MCEKACVEAKHSSSLKELIHEGAGTKILAVTYVDEKTIYSSNEVDVKWTLQSADVFVKSPIKPSLFYSVKLHEHVHVFS